MPKWFTVTNNGVVSGKFLACFIILQDASMSISPGIDIPFEKYNIHMFMLGMRGLKSNGLIDVKRPYMEVDYESLNVYKTVQQTAITKNIRT